jgi:hypothetical protein
MAANTIGEQTAIKQDLTNQAFGESKPLYFPYSFEEYPVLQRCKQIRNLP